jgi:hypothetical protein
MVAVHEAMRAVLNSERFIRGFSLIALLLLVVPSAAEQPAQPIFRDANGSQYTCASVSCVLHFMHERQCIAWTDGCQVVARPPHDFGRYIARAFIVPQRSQDQRTYLLLSLDPPIVMATVSGFIPVSTCPSRREFACVEGSPPPAHPIEGPPIGEMWLDQSEIHASWAPTGSGATVFGCLPIDYAHTQNIGDLPSRRGRPSSTIVSVCGSVFAVGGVR